MMQLGRRNKLPELWRCCHQFSLSCSYAQRRREKNLWHNMQHEIIMNVKLGQLQEAHSVYDDVKAKGGPLTLHICNNLLSATFDQLTGESTSWSAEQLAQQGEAVMRDMVEAGISPTEPTHANLIKRYVAADMVKQAEQSLALVIDCDKMILRRRTCSPLLVHYCESNQRDKAIELMRMVGGHGVGLSSTEFVPLLQLLQKQPQAQDAGVLQEEILLLMSRAVESLEEDELHQLAASVPSSELTSGSELFSSNAIGLLHLTEEQRGLFRTLLMMHAAKQGADKALEGFAQWLAKEGPFDLVMDCANVAWAERKDFSWSQIESIRRKAEPKGRTLMILSSHSRQRENNRKTRQHEKGLLKMWESEETKFAMHITPRGMNDDLFWMYATVAPGSQAVALTNDLMRDHHEPMGIDLRMFNRWKASKVVNFKIHPIAQIVPPKLYSREMQQSPMGWHIPATRHPANDTDEMEPTNDTSTSSSWLTIPLKTNEIKDTSAESMK